MTLGEVCLCTNGVKRLADFYKALLGADNGSEDEVHQFILTGEVALTVYDDGNKKNNANQNIALAFTVPDVDAEYERLLRMGVTVLEPPATRPWGARNLHLLDPDGNRVYLRSFPKE